jgi:hypothetical protein
MRIAGPTAPAELAVLARDPLDSALDHDEHLKIDPAEEYADADEDLNTLCGGDS